MELACNGVYSECYGFDSWPGTFLPTRARWLGQLLLQSGHFLLVPATFRFANASNKMKTTVKQVAWKSSSYSSSSSSSGMFREAAVWACKQVREFAILCRARSIWAARKRSERKIGYGRSGQRIWPKMASSYPKKNEPNELTKIIIYSHTARVKSRRTKADERKSERASERKERARKDEAQDNYEIYIKYS